MNLNEYFETKETISSFSKRTGIPSSSLSFWKNGKRPIPFERMAEIEIATGRAVTRKDLCSEWHRYWPELADQHK